MRLNPVCVILVAVPMCIGIAARPTLVRGGPGRTAAPAAARTQPAGPATRPTTHSAKKPATQPGAQPLSRPTRPATQPADFRAQVAREVARLVEELRARRFKSRQGAQEEILAIHRAYVDALMRYADDPDPEVRARVLDILGEAVSVTRFERVLAKLPAPQRAKLLRLREVDPQLVTDVFSLSWDRRLAAVKKIQDMKDEQGLAEPLLILCIDHPWETLSVAAINVVSGGKYRSDATVDALLKVLTTTPQEVWQRGYYDPRNPAPHLAALNAIKTIGSKRAAPMLLALLCGGQQHDVRRNMAVAEAIATTGEARAIPLLMEQLKNTNVYSTWSFNNVRLTMAPSDGALLALVKLAGQDPASYSFVSHNQAWGGQEVLYGFADPKDRTKAIKKFQDWWAKHKDQPPYKDLPPLDVPPLPDAQGNQPSS